MGALQSWGEATVISLQSLWMAFIEFLPSLIGALIVLLIGLVIAAALGRLATRIIDIFHVDQAVEKLGAKKGAERAGLQLNIAGGIGWLVKWFFIIVFIMAAADIVHLTEVTDFLKQVILYVPNIIVAIVVLLAAVLVANFMAKLIKGSVEVAGLVKANLLATVTKWVIVIFGILAALEQLNVARSLIATVITGLIAMLALAGGLAFGLGGKDQAEKIIKKIRQEISEKE